MDLREIYQIMRDRFHGKYVRDASVKVKLTDNSVIITATIYNNNTTFTQALTQYENSVERITSMFNKIVSEHPDFRFKHGYPTKQMMSDLDDLFNKNGYTYYLNNTDIVIELSISLG